MAMPWTVCLAPEFEVELDRYPPDARREILALALQLEQRGPMLGRPHADTLKDSRFANMKELRARTADGEWRVAFAFDPARRAILLCAGNKRGVGQDEFYRRLIALADRRFAAHLAKLKRK